MDETLRQLIRQARQQDDPETNLRLVQALDRAGHFDQIMRDIDHQPIYPITIHIGVTYHEGHPGYSRDIQMVVQPVNFTTLVLRAHPDVPYHAWPWMGTPDRKDATYTFSMFTFQDLEKSPFDAIDLAGFVGTWGAQREIFWLPLKSTDPAAYDGDATPTSTLPNLYLGGPMAPAIYFGDIRHQRITRDISDSIERWVDDHTNEMALANDQWNLFQLALQVGTYKGVLQRLKEEEAKLVKRTSNWLHNRW